MRPALLLRSVCKLAPIAAGFSSAAIRNHSPGDADSSLASTAANAEAEREDLTGRHALQPCELRRQIADDADHELPEQGTAAAAAL